MATARMYGDFIKGYVKFHRDISAMEAWMTKYADRKGLRLNPHRMFRSNLKIWMAENQTMYGTRICPCFEPTGDRHTDLGIVCPCSFAEDDIARTGTCHCKLFGRGDFTDEQFSEAERALMQEYRIPLALKDHVLDTRGVPQSENRRMDVPDPLHQIKQALNQVSPPLQVIVAREQSAKNILQFAELRSMAADYQPLGDAFIVSLGR